MAKRTGIMLPTLCTDKNIRRLNFPVIVQPKLEGDRLRSVIGVHSVSLKSSGDKIRVSVPHIHDELRISKGLTNIELDGELYAYGYRHSEIRSIVSRTRNLHKDYRNIEYHIYDIVSDEPQGDRLKRLEELMRRELQKHIKLVPHYYAYDISQIQDYYTDFLNQGYEGIIIRDRNSPYSRKKVSTMLKLKPRPSDYFTIIDVVEEVSITGVPKGTFGAFKCTTEDGAVFNVGSGVTDIQRQIIWSNQSKFIGQTVKVRFQGYTLANKVPKMQSIDKEWASNMETYYNL